MMLFSRQKPNHRCARAEDNTNSAKHGLMGRTLLDERIIVQSVPVVYE
jgi:hypothetical protein